MTSPVTVTAMNLMIKWKTSANNDDNDDNDDDNENSYNFKDDNEYATETKGVGSNEELKMIISFIKVLLMLFAHNDW